MPSDTKISEVAYAKINLALHVRARRPDGYHDLDTIFAFVNDGDHLSACHADQLSLEITGPFSAGLPVGEQNLAMKAAVLLQDHFRYSAGAAIHLDQAAQQIVEYQCKLRSIDCATCPAGCRHSGLYIQPAFVGAGDWNSFICNCARRFE
jgi:hypothetical protein